MNYLIKELCLSFLLQFSVYFASAECYYSNYELKFELSTISGDTLICYQSISTCDFDTNQSKNTNYLIKILQNGNTKDQLIVYKSRFKYSYCFDDTIDCFSGKNHFLYQLFERFELKKETVLGIRIIDILQVSALESISSNLRISDTSWMKSETKKVVSLSGYLCDHTISIFEMNSETENLINRIRALQAKLKEEEEMTDEKDALIWVFLKSTSSIDKLVIVSSCSD